MIFLQKKRDSKRNLFLKLKNIICYYQTLLQLLKTLKRVEFQNIICYYQTWRIQICDYQHTDFKTSYVITKLFFGYTINTAFTFQNIICYYQTGKRFKRNNFPSVISKHHMLLPNAGSNLYTQLCEYFKTSYVITKLTVLSHPSIR